MGTLLQWIWFINMTSVPFSDRDRSSSMPVHLMELLFMSSYESAIKGGLYNVICGFLTLYYEDTSGAHSLSISYFFPPISFPLQFLVYNILLPIYDYYVFPLLFVWYHSVSHIHTTRRQLVSIKIHLLSACCLPSTVLSGRDTKRCKRQPLPSKNSQFNGDSMQTNISKQAVCKINRK